MGRRLYGIDLDESPFGGLIERLLTEGELEKLADGGRPDGAGDDRDDAADHGGTTGDDDPVDGSASDDAADGDDRDVSADSFTWGDTSEASATGTGEFDVGPAGSGGPRGTDGPGDSSGPGETDGPGGGRDRYSPPGAGDYGHPGIDEESDEESEESGGIVSKLAAHRGLLIKATVALALVAVVAAIAWKYLGSVKSVVPGLGGRSSGDSDGEGASSSADAGAGSDVSPARRRAKVDVDTDEGGADAEAESDVDGTGASGEDVSGTGHRRASGKRSTGEPSPDDAASSRDDVDLGALVGLGTLALIAAVVRKFDEDRPHDPLVDGPEED